MDTDLRARLAASLRWLDPGPHSTHLVSDRSGWWRDPVIVAHLGPALGALFATARPTVVISPEVTGFLIGPLVATALGTGFVEAYKDDRALAIAEPLTWGAAVRDHRDRPVRLGVRGRHVRPGDRVLLVDDWVTTGAQLRSLRAAVATLGADTVGTAAIVAECSPGTAAELGVRSLLTPADLPSDDEPAPIDGYRRYTGAI